MYSDIDFEIIISYIEDQHEYSKKKVEECVQADYEAYHRTAAIIYQDLLKKFRDKNPPEREGEY